MNYKGLESIREEDFRRLTGIKRSICIKMIAILKEAEAKKKASDGKPNSELAPLALDEVFPIYQRTYLHQHTVFRNPLRHFHRPKTHLHFVLLFFSKSYYLRICGGYAEVFKSGYRYVYHT
ncbi:MAG: hypothetical protein K0R08_1702 [Solimicrobium sp.]|nr:hypothetical protein [Solimicrobium sp.]